MTWFPPINLWSKPYQKELDNIKFYRQFQEMDKMLKEADTKSLEKTIRDKEFLYYLRSGKIVKRKGE